MAAARQKEMNVSITLDATISRTRSGGGATVVRVEAITKGRFNLTGAFLSRRRSRFLTIACALGESRAVWGGCQWPGPKGLDAGSCKMVTRVNLSRKALCRPR